MKVRFGIGTGSTVMSGDTLGSLVADVESWGFDSLWWSDVLTTPGDDPLAAMAYAAGCGVRLKIGTTMVLPGRNPVRLAKQLATLDQLSGGRLLVTFVLGLRLPGELDAMGVAAGERGAQADELLPLLRRLWSEDGVDHTGRAWTLRAVRVEPKPRQQPFDVWLGGNAPSALRRAGRLADGWLPALCTPVEAAQGRRAIEEAADAAGRRIDPEHYGVSIGFTGAEPPPELLARLAARRRLVSGSAEADRRDLVPVGTDELRRLVERFVEVGFSKFVVRPLGGVSSWRHELEALAGALLPLQS